MVPWPFPSKPPGSSSDDNNKKSSSSPITHLITSLTSPRSSFTSPNWSSYGEPSNLIATCLLTATILGGARLYRKYLRRIPDADNIEQSWFRKRSLLGYVTSVGDGDNFRMFHTPGGVLAGWGWARKVPELRKELKGRTLHVRLAGIDAPELAHFGNPSQPYGAEALAFLKSYLLHRRVRAYIHRPDQYGRVVATVYANRLPYPFNNPKTGFSLPLPLPMWVYGRDVSMVMLRKGLATVYEAKFGAEYGGERMERKYRRAEARAKRWERGMWRKKGRVGFFETPREFKTRMSELQKAKDGVKGAAAGTTMTTTKRSYTRASSAKKESSRAASTKK